MKTGFIFRGTALGTRAKESNFDGKASTKWFLGVMSSVQNEYGHEDQKTQEFRIGNSNDFTNLLNYYNSLKGKIVEVSFENRKYTLDDGRQGTNIFVTGVIECKPEK
ncbi:DNA-binding protein [Citrobacter meridianamericanus]|uniref:DNA-binding protein n=1 Tax=Citrobacter meridianamericanus TaxID=2894201 RepID=UPI00351D05EC